MPSPGGAPTLLLRFYRLATALIAPFAYRSVTRKLRDHDVSVQRIHERLGNASLPARSAQPGR